LHRKAHSEETIMTTRRHDDQPPIDTARVDALEASRLLVETERRARRGFATQRPLPALVGAVVVLVVYGSIWLSVRHQSPYTGPSGAVIGLVYGLVGVSVAVNVTMYRRATRGVTGASRQADAITALAVAAPWAAVYVFMGALLHDGFGHPLVYGVIDAAGPWLVVGAAVAGMAAARGRWETLIGALVVVGIGTGAAYAGPAGVWGVLALGGCVGLLVVAAVRFASLHRA
jgi:hypothetical protein